MRSRLCCNHSVALQIAGFVIVPFLFGTALSFTNQRLISPNPTERTSFANDPVLFGMRVLALDPVANAAGAGVIGNGAPEYPALRSFTRGNPDYAHLQGA